MIRNWEIVIGRITLKALDRALLLSDNVDVIDGGFEPSVIVEGFISVAKAVVISNRLLGVLGGNIVSVTISLLANISHCL